MNFVNWFLQHGSPRIWIEAEEQPLLNRRQVLLFYPNWGILS